MSESGRRPARAGRARRPGPHTDAERRQRAVRDALLAVLDGLPGAGASFGELDRELRHRLLPHPLFPGGRYLRWHAKAAQLQLEAEGVLERVPGVRPLRLRPAAGRGTYGVTVGIPAR
jgi:hypothetical protein